MLTHKYSHSLRGFCPACAGSLALASSQGAHVTNPCVRIGVESQSDAFFLLCFLPLLFWRLQFKVDLDSTALLCTVDRVDFVFVWGLCCNEQLKRWRSSSACLCECTQDVFICCDLQRCRRETHSCSGKGGLWGCVPVLALAKQFLQRRPALCAHLKVGASHCTCNQQILFFLWWILTYRAKLNERGICSNVSWVLFKDTAVRKKYSNLHLSEMFISQFCKCVDTLLQRAGKHAKPAWVHVLLGFFVRWIVKTPPCLCTGLH